MSVLVCFPYLTNDFSIFIFTFLKFICMSLSICYMGAGDLRDQQRVSDTLEPVL